MKGGNSVSCSAGKSIAVGLCKRCGKVIEFNPVTVISREIGPPCISFGESSVRELQNELHKNAKYCGECSKEMHRALIKRLVSLPKLFIKRQK
jgi:hypothetical protein